MGGHGGQASGKDGPFYPWGAVKDYHIAVAKWTLTEVEDDVARSVCALCCAKRYGKEYMRVNMLGRYTATPELTRL